MELGNIRPGRMNVPPSGTAPASPLRSKQKFVQTGHTPSTFATCFWYSANTHCLRQTPPDDYRLRHNVPSFRPMQRAPGAH